ncbi:MAG: FxsA family protein [Pseudomonadota bacterium]
MRLFLLLVAVPIIEIALFIEIGGWLGTWPTVGIVILTALVGSWMLRLQGLKVLSEFQGRMMAGEEPGQLLADGAMILFAGALLLTPGFFTDAVGFLLLVPGIRRAVYGWAKRAIPVHVHQSQHSAGMDSGWQHPGEQTVDGSFEDVTTAERPSDGTQGSHGKALPRDPQ